MGGGGGEAPSVKKKNCRARLGLSVEFGYFSADPGVGYFRVRGGGAKLHFCPLKLIKSQTVRGGAPSPPLGYPLNSILLDLHYIYKI